MANAETWNLLHPYHHFITRLTGLRNLGTMAMVGPTVRGVLPMGVLHKFLCVERTEMNWIISVDPSAALKNKLAAWL